MPWLKAVMEVTKSFNLTCTHQGKDNIHIMLEYNENFKINRNVLWIFNVNLEVCYPVLGGWSEAALDL